MTEFSSFFSGGNFQSTITKFCGEHGWKIAEIDDRHAVLRFSMESGRHQTLYIIRYESTLEFSVPSNAAFDSEDSLPHELSTLLCKRNAQKKIGFWCIEEIQGKLVYSYMHNVELKLMDSEFFGRVVRACVKECDDFEGMIKGLG